MKSTLLFALLLVVISASYTVGLAQAIEPTLQYTVSFPQPGTHTYQVELHTSGWNQDTLNFKLPNWMPGYYQLLNYSKNVNAFSVKEKSGKSIPFDKINDNTWRVTGARQKSLTINYSVTTSRQFVANSYVDSAHAYLIPGNTFLYVDDFLHLPVSVKISLPTDWKDIATGLERVAGKSNEFTAPDFDILYDSPLLIGELEELPAFTVKGINHRFIGYKMGEFDKVKFMEQLKKIVEASVAIIGDIPYKEYTFIAIGPGRGGIEHLNNTTVSFDGNTLNNPDALNRMLNFLAHEYFHHYNVKRIRPFELGPFDYDLGSRTNLLWVSEGLTVYYEYLVVKRAGLVDEKTFLANFIEEIQTLENNPGRLHQSLIQASYNTWKDGPFGTQGEEAGKTISYYNKGPVVALVLDFAIRQATQNDKSLDDVMRLLYWKYYKEKERGFTDAEFQAACEAVAATSLAPVFEYVYTTKELDYATYLKYAGLEIAASSSISTDNPKSEKKITISRLENPTALQSSILKAWLGE